MGGRKELLVVLLTISSCLSEKQENINSYRDRRSIPWPTFLGGSGLSGSTDTSDNPIPPAVYSSEIPTQNLLPNKQLTHHYPIWRVHKFNGIDLKPLPVSLIPQIPNPQLQQQQGYYETPIQYTEQAQNHAETAANIEISQQPDLPSEQYYLGPANSYQPFNTEFMAQNQQVHAPEQLQPQLQPQQQHTYQTTNGVSNKNIPFELLKLARSLGIKHFNQLPSLEEAMNLLGTTTTEETISIIKELAGTEDGRELIKQFLQSNEQGGSDLESAQSQYVPTQYQQTSADIPQSNYVDQSIQVQRQPQNVRPQHVTVLGQVGSTLDRVQTDVELLKNIAPTPRPQAGLLERITSFTNFFAPPNKSENPLTPNLADISDQIRLPSETSVMTIPIPALPGLPDLQMDGFKNIPQVPVLPNIHIPQHLPLDPKTADSIAKGTYVRVRYPLHAFNPIPNMPLAENYQLESYDSVVDERNAGHPSQLQSESVLNQLELPIYDAYKKPFNPAKQVPTNVGQLPVDNYDVFRDAPRIVTSFNTPVLHYNYPEDDSTSSSSAIEEQRVSIELPNPETIVQNQETDLIDKAIQRRNGVNDEPKRNSAYDAYATGKIYKADPDAIRLWESGMVGERQQEPTSN